MGGVAADRMMDACFVPHVMDVLLAFEEALDAVFVLRSVRFAW